MTIHIFDYKITYSTLVEYAALTRIKNQNAGIGNAITLVKQLLSEFNVLENGRELTNSDYGLTIAAIATLPIESTQGTVTKLYFESNVQSLIAYKADKYDDEWQAIDLLSRGESVGVDIAKQTYTETFDHIDGMLEAAQILGVGINPFGYIIKLRNSGQFIPLDIVELHP